MADKAIQWLLECDEPWTRYRTRVDLLGQPETDSEVRAARAAMLSHPQVRQLMAEAAAWPGPPLKRHNDASHPLYKLSTLADFGVQARDRGTSSLEGGMASIIKAVLAHPSAQGAFQTMVNIPAAFGGTNENMWTWMACDAPTCSAAYPSCAPTRAFERWSKPSRSRQTHKVVTPPARCIRRGKAGRLPTRNNPRRGSH